MKEPQQIMKEVFFWVGGIASFITIWMFITPLIGSEKIAEDVSEVTAPKKSDQDTVLSIPESYESKNSITVLSDEDLSTFVLQPDFYMAIQSFLKETFLDKYRYSEYQRVTISHFNHYCLLTGQYPDDEFVDEKRTVMYSKNNMYFREYVFWVSIAQLEYYITRDSVLGKSFRPVINTTNYKQLNPVFKAGYKDFVSTIDTETLNLISKVSSMVRMHLRNLDETIDWESKFDLLAEREKQTGYVGSADFDELGFKTITYEDKCSERLSLHGKQRFNAFFYRRYKDGSLPVIRLISSALG